MLLEYAPPSVYFQYIPNVVYVLFTAGKRVTDDEVEEMLENDNLNVFTQDVSWNIIIVLQLMSYV